MAIFLGLYLAALHGRETARQFTGLPAVAMVTCAGFFALGSTLHVTSLTLTSTANVSTIGALAPVFVMLTSRHATGEAPGKAAWTAALLALVGVFLIFREGLESGRSLGILALRGPVQLAVPLILFARGARKVAAATLSLIALLDTVLNPLWAWMGA